MNFNVLTLFPNMFTPVKESILGRAEKEGLLSINLIDFREYSKDKHKKTDDYSYGGGQGMVMTCQPIFDALESLGDKSGKIIYMSPRGKKLDSEKIHSLSLLNNLTILCGHYEGVDQRVIDYWDMEEVSIGDYILTGGELPAMVLIDAISRMVPGVLSGEKSVYDESIYSGLLEYPQYTKPSEFRTMKVPEVLLSGHHKNIELWRFEEALKLTQKNRPDLLEKFSREYSNTDKELLKVLEKVLKCCRISE